MNARKAQAKEERGVKTRAEVESFVKKDHFEALRQIKTRNALNVSFLNRLHQERLEAETEAVCSNDKSSQSGRSDELKQEDKLTQDMAKNKVQLSHEILRREILRNSEELQTLQQKLKRAYVNKHLAIQQAEKKAKEMLEKRQQKEELMAIIEHENFMKEEVAQTKIAENQNKLKYKEELHDQMIMKQKKKEEEYQDLLVESTLLDESLRTVLEEDKRDEELKLIKKQIAREDFETELEAKKLWFEKELKFQEEEDRKIREYLEYKEKKEKELEEENKKKEEIRMQQRMACVNILSLSQDQRLERQRIAQILLGEDIRLKDEERERKNFEKKLRDAYELNEINAKQIENHIKSYEETRLEELKFCQQIFEENNKAILTERKELERKRQENLEFGKSLRGLMEQHRINKIKELNDEYQQNQLALEEITKRRALIDEERQSILKQHAGNLLGFIPKGVIREEDLAYLDPEVRKFYGRSTEIHVKNDSV